VNKKEVFKNTGYVADSKEETDSLAKGKRAEQAWMKIKK